MRSFGAGKIRFTPIWFDSLGAKSSCCLVETPDVRILIDPGAAAMQPGFPATEEQKWQWLVQAEEAIEEASTRADVVVVSHYHHDHYMDDPHIYAGKTLFTKNPNRYINDSQRGRAERFFDRLCRHFHGEGLEKFWQAAHARTFPDPMQALPLAAGKDYGDYNDRKKELLEKGLKWFRGRVKKWNRNKHIPELDFERLQVRFAEGREFTFGETKLRFSDAWFHGIEFSRVGWIFITIVEHQNDKFLYSSDVNGPIIEDYAEFIIAENPDILVLDGPMTYMFGYTLNRINLDRAIENACRIVEGIEAGLILYDHHLPRERRFRERTQRVWELSPNVMTAAEFLGRTPCVLLGEAETGSDKA